MEILNISSYGGGSIRLPDWIKWVVIGIIVVKLLATFLYILRSVKTNLDRLEKK